MMQYGLLALAASLLFRFAPHRPVFDGLMGFFSGLAIVLMLVGLVRQRRA